MPETRYIEVYEQGTGVLLRLDPYEVSDEELELEQREEQLIVDELRACDLLELSPDVITMPHIWELLRIFGRRLGYDF